MTVEALLGQEHAMSVVGLRSFAFLVWGKITPLYLKTAQGNHAKTYEGGFGCPKES